MPRNSTILPVLLMAVCWSSALGAEESRFTQTHSRSQYVHWIDLYDANDRVIDPAAETAAPYSPQYTCGRCHDYAAIAGGHHFNAIHKKVAPGRPGEPWIWTDQRTGTQLPLSYRGWPGTYDPGALGISSRDFVLKFGRHLPGGGPGESLPDASEGVAKQPEASKETKASNDKPSKAAAEARRWKLSGLLNVDCMICHTNGNGYSQEAWWTQIQRENFAWASSAAIGLGTVEGDVSKLPDDFDPAKAAADSPQKLPATRYARERINGEKKVFFDVVRKPDNNACYYCHSTHLAGAHAPAAWTLDEDVHLRAGFTCADCHSNGIDHHTVRSFEGEEHPSGERVETLSCRGCHLGEGQGGGRMGAPKPLHQGLPPLHFEKLACTTCHCGPEISKEAGLLQTSLAHGLGLPSHETAEIPPGIAAPVMLRDGEMLYPHRMVWPAFWGQKAGEVITPLNPDAVYEATRKTLRVRRGTGFSAAMTEVRLTSAEKKEILGDERSKVKDDQLTEEEKAKVAEAVAARGRDNWREKLAAALTDLKKIVTDPSAEPVFVSAGTVYRLSGEKSVEVFDHAAARPYAWKFGHDVRPARLALGANGCYDCHTLDAPLFTSTVAAMGQAPDEAPPAQAMYQLAGYDKMKLDAWALSFLSRTAFKYFGYGAMGVVALVLLAYLVQGVAGLASFGRRR
ncbi:MAG: hypothetical protein HUU20_07760 [Pirellulales bacterium]|nr:hypothetical protein [Pirellulales bacterium]